MPQCSMEMFSQVGVPINSANQMDVYQENEELKEELQKLAAKVTAMLIHLLVILVEDRKTPIIHSLNIQ